MTKQNYADDFKVGDFVYAIDTTNGNCTILLILYIDEKRFSVKVIRHDDHPACINKIENGNRILLRDDLQVMMPLDKLKFL